jgi:hypothetical protein
MFSRMNALALVSRGRKGCVLPAPPWPAGLPCRSLGSHRVRVSIRDGAQFPSLGPRSPRVIWRKRSFVRICCRGFGLPVGLTCCHTGSSRMFVCLPFLIAGGHLEHSADRMKVAYELRYVDGPTVHGSHLCLLTTSRLDIRMKPVRRPTRERTND